MNLPSPDGVQVIFTVCTLAALWVGWAKVVWPVIKRIASWVADIWTVFKGRKERIDRVTGDKREAVPSLVDALVLFRKTQDKQGELLEKQGASIENLTTVLTQVADQQITLQEHTKQIADLRLASAVHTEQIGLLKAGTDERTAIRKENASLFEAVARRDSDVIDPQEEP